MERRGHRTTGNTVKSAPLFLVRFFEGQNLFEKVLKRTIGGHLLALLVQRSPQLLDGLGLGNFRVIAYQQ